MSNRLLKQQQESSLSEMHIERNWPGPIWPYLQQQEEILMASQVECKRWNVDDEISKLLNASLDSCFPSLKEEPVFFRSAKEDHGDFTCQNVLTIWPKLKQTPGHPHIEPIVVGEAIKENLPESAIDMIEGQPSVLDAGFVTFSLSPKWMAQSIHKMLRVGGIGTWAPKLPVEMVLVKYPSLREEIPTGLFRRNAIAGTLLRMLNHSGVYATLSDSPPPYVNVQEDMLGSFHGNILKKWFSIVDGRLGNLHIGVEDKPPLILAKKDLYHLYTDLEALRCGFKEENADWIVYVTPVRQQEYIEMCFTAAKLEKWTPTDRKWKCIQDGTSYVGYRTCNIGPKELASFLKEVDYRCYVVAQGEDVQLLGYNAEAISDCVLQYTFLKHNRLANCAFSFVEMVGEEGNTFVYLLKTRAKILSMTLDYREDIEKLIKSSELIVEIHKQSEGALELLLLEYTEALKRSCSYISPHILCDYLYELSKEFTNYYSSVCEVKPVAKSTLLLCEATRAVIDRCFILLGLMPWNHHIQHSCGLRELKALLIRQYVSNKETKKRRRKLRHMKKANLPKEYVDRCIAPCFVSVARDPLRNSRFEVFSIQPFVTTKPKFKTGEMFGFIAISDKYGLLPDEGSHLLESDFAYVHLFDHEWYQSIKMHDGEYICLGNSSSSSSVAFSSSIEVSMEIYVKTEKACYELCRGKFELKLFNIWGKNLDNQCCSVDVKGKDGFTKIYFMLMKDAVDADVQITYKTANEAQGCKVLGEIYAYYGSDVLDHCRASTRPCYRALLFRSGVPVALEGDKIPLRKSVMAVPKGAPLKIFADFRDIESEEMILFGTCELSSLTNGSNEGNIKGTGCSLSVSVKWKYQAY